MNRSRVLIITGMHRSATSLVAALFQRAGVNMGVRLLAPNRQNPLGFFEDADFYEFHEQLLRARGENILVPRDFELTPTPPEVERAKQLIQARSSRALWGWKDPRTSLCLEFWRELLPDACFLFLYRHPLDVLLSLVRRSEIYNFGLFDGLEAWYTYNLRIKEFCERHADAVLLCHSYSVLDRIEEFNAQLGHKFGRELQLTPALRTLVYHPDQLRRVPLNSETHAILKHIHREAVELYAQLQTMADLPVDSTIKDSSSRELSAFAAMVASLNEPSSLVQRRSLLFVLLALLEPEPLEHFFEEHAQYIRQLEQAAAERQRIILEQQAWAQPRMGYLKKLEASAPVRLLVRLGMLPRSDGY